MDRYVVELREVDLTRVAAVGGKGAHLGELSRIEGVRVPAGFCVTTGAFRRTVAQAPSFEARLERLMGLAANDVEAVRGLSAEIRGTIEAVPIPGDVEKALVQSVIGLGEHAAFAVRSSATAEDLPTASFAGQQDTYLNVVGPRAILQHVSRCWASLFTERAVLYRLRNGFDHRSVRMAVVVQRMVFPQVSGTLFTADPLTGNRKVLSVEATYGLGEALVSGLVDADAFKVRGGEVVHRAEATKRLALRASPGGGIREEPVPPELQDRPALTDAQVVRLAELGRRIEAHFGHPQDIEWCLDADEFQIVQSRPITTLFPIPVRNDQENRVYLSVGHQQMMTDPMKPLGISFWQMVAGRPMYEAGGRMFVDVTETLASPAGRAGLLEAFGKADPLVADALKTLLDRGDFLPPLPGETPEAALSAGPPPAEAPSSIATDPAIVTELIERTQASIATLKSEIRTKSGPELLDFILSDIPELKRVLADAESSRAIMAGMEATWWLNEKLQLWLGERNGADILTQSVPYNVTSEMGLALLDVADAIRPYPEVVAFLQAVENDDFLDELPGVRGGHEARGAIQGWLDQYGMRGVGEIDITRPRWGERPSTLVPLILGNLRNFEPGAGQRRFEHGREQAWNKERELLERLRVLPDGERKAEEVKRMVDRVRTFAGYREYPKYGMISRFFVYKQALLKEADRLVQEGVISESEDIFYLTFEELQEAVRMGGVDEELVRWRREAFRSHRTLTPPRVLTSEGEVVAASYRSDDAPPGALVGLPVSGGIVEGRARVVLDMAEAELEAGDILVTTYTDPSWTPLFLAIGGLVTEVGGLMTHGAVIAREYGLPAVVGVGQATRLIKDGQWIRVHGTAGHVEIVPSRTPQD